jgi:hypothetical protein
MWQLPKDKMSSLSTSIRRIARLLWTLQLNCEQVGLHEISSEAASKMLSLEVDGCNTHFEMHNGLHLNACILPLCDYLCSKCCCNPGYQLRCKMLYMQCTSAPPFLGSYLLHGYCLPHTKALTAASLPPSLSGILSLVSLLVSQALIVEQTGKHTSFHPGLCPWTSPSPHIICHKLTGA